VTFDKSTLILFLDNLIDLTLAKMLQNLFAFMDEIPE